MASAAQRGDIVDTSDELTGRAARVPSDVLQHDVVAAAEPRDEVLQDLRALSGRLENLGEQVLRVEHLVGDVAEDLLEAPVFLPGATAEQDVVEEKFFHHRRHHPGVVI